MTADSDPTYRIRDAVTWREVDGDIVALETEASLYFSIAGTGTLLWPELVDGASRQGMIDTLTESYPEVGAERVASDVDEFVATCIGDGLIEAVDG